MALYKPGELRDFLSSIGAHPKKGLSQNFLIDGNIIKKIVSSAGVNPGDLVLEIGPGPGALTEALLAAGANVIAVEKDTVLAAALRRLDPTGERLKIYCDDIMDFPVESRVTPLPGTKAKVIANLPYHLTSPILTSLVHLHTIFDSITVMVQDEVAARFTAKSGNKDYGSITVFLNYHSTPNYQFLVSKNCFYPAPKVQSAVVTLQLHPPPKISDESLFFVMVRKSFQQRRKMLKASLKELYDPESVCKALETITGDPFSRPEQLSLDNFIALFNALQGNGTHGK